MRTVMPALALVPALLLAASLALADENMRCGKWIVDDEITLEDLVKKCGLPQSKEIETTEIRRRGANGVGTHVAGTTTIEKWLYKRTPRSFPMLVTIEDGKVKSIARAE